MLRLLLLATCIFYKIRIALYKKYSCLTHISYIITYQLTRYFLQAIIIVGTKMQVQRLLPINMLLFWLKNSTFALLNAINPLLFALVSEDIVFTD